MAPVAEERGPEGMARGSGAQLAAASRHPEHRVPAPSGWTQSAAAPGGEKAPSLSVRVPHNTREIYLILLTWFLN